MNTTLIELPFLDPAEVRLERRRDIWRIFEDHCDENAAPWKSQTAKYLRYIRSNREAVGVMIAGRAYMWSIIDRIAESSIDVDEQEGFDKVSKLISEFMRAGWQRHEVNPNWLPFLEDFDREFPEEMDDELI